MKKRVSRSLGGDLLLLFCLLLLAAVMLLPIVYAVVTSLKPNNELWLFPPRFYVRNPTLKNYRDLFELMSTSWVPFTRYFFNTCFITVVGSVGHIFLATMCAYPLACYRFPGSRMIFSTVQTALMFSAAVMAIPSFIVISVLHLVDTYWALILPAMGSATYVFLMRQFLVSMPDSYIEAARLDGANEWQIMWKIGFPYAKPAWATIIVYQFMAAWSDSAGPAIYIADASKQTLPVAIATIGGSLTTQGASAALTLLMLIPSTVVFVLMQAKIVTTMSFAGLKD